jgi:hypothetical protein
MDDEPMHKPQEYTQKLLELGVVEFFETIIYMENNIHEIYKVSRDYIITHNGRLNYNEDWMYAIIENYKDKKQFNGFFIIDENNINILIMPDELDIFKKIEL